MLWTAGEQGASFDPETIALMAEALESAIADLSHPRGSRHAQALAISILGEAAQDQRDKSRLYEVSLETMKRGA